MDIILFVKDSRSVGCTKSNAGDVPVKFFDFDDIYVCTFRIVYNFYLNFNVNFSFNYLILINSFEFFYKCILISWQDEKQWNKTVQDGISKYFAEDQNVDKLSVFTVTELNDALTRFTEQGDNTAFETLDKYVK